MEHKFSKQAKNPEGETVAAFLHQLRGLGSCFGHPMFLAFAKVTNFLSAENALVCLYFDFYFLGFLKAYRPFSFAAGCTNHLSIWHFNCNLGTDRQFLVLFAARSLCAFLLAAFVWLSFGGS